MDDLYTMRIKDVIKHCDFIINGNENINGIGLGNKKINSNWTEIPALVVMVRKKISKNNLKRNEIIPKYINGVLTDVVEVKGNEVDNRVFKNEFKGIVSKRPLCGGVVIGLGNKNVGINDFGILSYPIENLKDSKSNYALTSARVVTADEKISYRNAKIIQPPIASKGNEVDTNTFITQNKIGEVSKITSIDPTSKKVNDMNKVYAAMIKLDSNIKIEAKLQDGTSIGSIYDTKVGDEVFVLSYDRPKKVLGKVKYTAMTVELEIGKSKIWFTDQIAVDTRLTPNDYGTLGLMKSKEEKKVATFGMYMASKSMSDNEENSIAFFNPMQQVLYELNAKLVDVGGSVFYP